MSNVIDLVESLPLKQYTEKAYLDYSMYVILDRALPNIGDGLKPVQRRIVYAMSELGLKQTAKFKKSARTVGDVLGKYHPHGDSACYEAMVLMAQPFSYRYPLIDGQGNWGSIDDPKSFAAMRYTESRLQPYAQLLLSELGQATVDWLPNFDGTLQEPKCLPARVPNVLLNGGTGIAVGMSTDIPPHNLTEVLQACITLLNDKGAGLDEVCEHIQGPDFPTRAEIITPEREIKAMYVSGKGSLKMRGLYEVDNGDIVITALPHQASGAKILEQIAAQMQAKKLPMVSDLRDESDHENPVRLVIIPKSSRVDVAVLMDHLFATTDLEKHYRINMNVIGLDGRPKVMGLVYLLRNWLEFRRSTVIRRLEYRLEQVVKRLHILEGYMVAFLNMDEVIAIIRSEDHPKMALIERFDISEKQAEAILELKLRQIAKLEEIKIRDEQDKLQIERDNLEKILGSKARLKTLMVKELKQIIDEYGDERCSPIVERKESKALSESELIASEPVTIVLSEKGWARVAKGHEVDAAKLNYRSGDSYLCAVLGKSNEAVVFMDSTGRSYSVQAFTLPSARGLGEPLSGKLNPPSGAAFISAMMGSDEDGYLIASDAGFGFVTTLGDMVTKNKAGKSLLTLPKGARVMSPVPLKSLEGKLKVAVLSNEGRLLIFDLDELPSMARGKGNKMINITSARAANREEYVLAVVVLTHKTDLSIKAGKRHLTLSPKDWSHYEGERGRRGNKLPRGYQKVSTMNVVVHK